MIFIQIRFAIRFTFVLKNYIFGNRIDFYNTEIWSDAIFETADFSQNLVCNI